MIHWIIVGIVLLGMLAAPLAIVVLVVYLVRRSQGPPPTSAMCPTCNGPLMPSGRYCPHCGRPLSPET